MQIYEVAMSVPKLSDESLNAWKALISAHANIVRSIESLLNQRQKIPITWFDILWTLRKTPDRRLRFRTLDGEIALSRSALSRAVDALSRTGFVEKLRSNEDLRGIDVVLTEAGNRALAAAWPVYVEGIARYFAAGLTAEDCTRLTEILQRIQPPTASNRSES